MLKDALTPQARHHFTRFDQVGRLVSTSEAAPDSCPPGMGKYNP